MKAVKAIFAALLALAMVLGFASCSNGGDGGGSNNDGNSDNNDVSGELVSLTFSFANGYSDPTTKDGKFYLKLFWKEKDYYTWQLCSIDDGVQIAYCGGTLEEIGDWKSPVCKFTTNIKYEKGFIPYEAEEFKQTCKTTQKGTNSNDHTIVEMTMQFKKSDLYTESFQTEASFKKTTGDGYYYIDVYSDGTWAYYIPDDGFRYNHDFFVEDDIQTLEPKFKKVRLLGKYEKRTGDYSNGVFSISVESPESLSLENTYYYRKGLTLNSEKLTIVNNEFQVEYDDEYTDDFCRCDSDDIDYYLVTFDSMYGSEVSEQGVKVGESAQKPENPEKDNNEFIAWYKDDEEFDFSTPITENILLTAKWNRGNAASGKIGAYNKPYEVGDIIFSDGSATPYTAKSLTSDQKNKAIAVIFYIGTNCSNDEEVRTLGVGLRRYLYNEHGSSAGYKYLSWCTKDANAFDLLLTPILCDIGGKNGNLTFSGDKNGSDNFEQISAFLVESGIEDDTGTAENYPAFYYAKNYKSDSKTHIADTDYETGWYLPTIAELYEIYKSQERVDMALELCGGNTIGNSECWSSSPESTSQKMATTFDFSLKIDDARTKSQEYPSACVIHEF